MLTNRKLRKSPNSDNKENKEILSSLVANISPLPLSVRNFSFLNHDMFLIPLKYFPEECVAIPISRRSLGNLITTWTMFAPSYFIRFLSLFCFALFFYLIRWLCNQLWHMRRQNNTANEKKQLVTPCAEKGRAFRNIGQNNTYSFHCLISLAFLICI